MFERIHHVAYTVNDLERYRPFFAEELEMEEENYREMPDDGYKAAIYRVGETYIEVQEPLAQNEKAEFLETHGNGLNHVAYEVDDIAEAVATLEERGIERAWDEPIVAPTFPDCKLIDMETETSEEIFLQLVEEMDE